MPPIPEIYAGELDWVLRRRLNRLKSDDQSAKGCKAPLTLEMMPEKAASDGAVCLDGTPGGWEVRFSRRGVTDGNGTIGEVSGALLSGEKQVG